jgi:hypothetical protein
VAKYAISLYYTTTPSSASGSTEDQATKANDSHDPAWELQNYAPLLVSAAFEFIAGHMDNNFTLYAKAQSKSLPNRTPESLRGVSGSMLPNPQQEEQKTGLQPEIPSAFLISLPHE